LNQHTQAEAAGPNPFYVGDRPAVEWKSEVPRLSTIEEVALEYVHDLRRTNDALQSLAFRPAPHPDEALVAQNAAIRAKNTDLEAANRSLRNINLKVHQQIADLQIRNEIQAKAIEGLRKANKSFADKAVKPEPARTHAEAIKAMFGEPVQEHAYDGDCTVCGDTACDFNPKYVKPADPQGVSQFAVDMAKSINPAKTMDDDILAKYAAAGEAEVAKMKAAEAAGMALKSAAAADAVWSKADAVAKANSDPYYTAPSGEIDGDKVIREARARLDEFTKSIHG
jgi:hypothetical protein